MTHTLGPWIEFADQGKTVAIMPAMRDGDVCAFSKPPNNDDARLIAAAPDMLAALKEAEYFFKDDFPDGVDGPCAVTTRYREAYRAMLAAIHKAEPKLSE